jgi:response regulator RpfG family c-di-GMP phosphodiesterase
MRKQIISFCSQDIDLVIPDIKMSKMIGFELYAKLISEVHTIKALLLTALRGLDDYDDFRRKVIPKLGERHFVQKPNSGIGH